VVVVPLTSQLRGLRGEVDIGKPRWLPKYSAVNIRGFASIDQHALIRRLGKLSDGQFSAVKNAIREMLDL
jgi:mRNA-degrading endonuclease toxin of MazEF toxin-antitoxin module